MAKKKVARGGTRRVRDKWRMKQWYTVRAPRAFNGNVVAETMSDEPDKLMGRVAEVTLQELTGDFSKMHVKLRFKVNSVKGADCWTKFVGHELTSDYVRRLTRRKHSKVDSVVDVRTSDGWVLRVKPLGVTENRTKSSQQVEIRGIMQRLTREAAARQDVGGLVKDIVSGDLAQRIYKDARVIYPLKRVEIRKCEVVKEPENFEPEVDVFPEPEPTETEATESTEEEATEESEGGGALDESESEAPAGEAAAGETPEAAAEDAAEEEGEAESESEEPASEEEASPETATEEESEEEEPRDAQ